MSNIQVNLPQSWEVARAEISKLINQHAMTLNAMTRFLQLADGVTAPAATASGVAMIYIDTADGDLKVKFSDGTVKTIVTDT